MKRYVKSSQLPAGIEKFTLDKACIDNEGASREEVASWFTDRPADEIKFLYEKPDGSYTGIEFTDGTFSIVGARIDTDDITYDEMMNILKHDM